MSGLWSRTLVYLGLREEDDELYYDHPQGGFDQRRGPDPRDPYDAAEPDDRFEGYDDRSGRASRERPYEEHEVGRGRRSSRDERDRRDPLDDPDPRGRDLDDPRARSRALGRDERMSDSGRIAAIGSGNVRRLRPEEPASRTSVPTTVKVVHVASFEDCEVIGTRFRTNQPVLFDVRSADKRVARRVIDFVSGVTFVAYGTIKRIGDAAYLLVPDGVTITSDERRRLLDLGYDLSGVPGR